MLRLALQERHLVELDRHLAAASPEEEGAFFLLREAKATQGTRLIAGEMILPPPDAWERQAEGQLRPSARWLSAVISAAVEAESGLLFVHSHPGALHPAELSSIDRLAVESLGETLQAILEGPFAATVVHESSWAGVLWSETTLEPLGPISAIGRGYRILSRPARLDAADRDLDARQADALGGAHDRLRRLSVGLVGAGGLGSPLAEQLVRMGVGRLVLIDDDTLDTESNVRRVFGSVKADLLSAVAPPKVDVLGRHLDLLGLGTEIVRVKGDVTEQAVFGHLLDADLVFCATDTHSSRAVINDLPSTYLMPVIDVGVRVGNRTDASLAGLVAELRLLTPERPCLWCRGVLSADAIRAENLPADERRSLAREGYLVGAVGEPAPSVAALTVLGSALAACTLLGLLSDEDAALPSGRVLDGLYGDSFENATEPPKPDCRCQAQLALADSSPPPLR